MNTHAVSREFSIRNYQDIAAWLNSLAGSTIEGVGTVSYVNSASITALPGGFLIVTVLVLAT